MQYPILAASEERASMQELARTLVLCGVMLTRLQSEGWTVPVYEPVCCMTCATYELSASHPAVVTAYDQWLTKEGAFITSALTEQQRKTLHRVSIDVGLQVTQSRRVREGCEMHSVQLLAEVAA